MTNFLGILINSLKQGESVKHHFMGEYGVVIAIFKKGELCWVESTWSMGMDELRRALVWGGGRFTSKPTPPEDAGKKNITVDRKGLISTLLSWETDILHLPGLDSQPQNNPGPELLENMHSMTPGELVSVDGPMTGAGFVSALDQLKEGKFTGFLRVIGTARGLVFVARGKGVVAFALHGDTALLGTSAMDWLAQQVDIQVEMIKLDLFTATCFVVPLLGHEKTAIPADSLEDFIHKTQADVHGVYFIHLHMKGAHAFAMVYREVYAGTLARKKGEERASVLPMAVILRLAMLPGAQIDSYRYDVPQTEF